MYGTLKTGYVNHSAMKKLGGKIVGVGSVMKSVLIDTHGNFPYMISATDWRNNATGELWEFANKTSFKALDQIEVPAGYIPTMVDVTTNDKSASYHSNVLTYMYPGIYYDNGVVKHITTDSEIEVNRVLDGKQWDSVADNNGVGQLFK